MDVHVETEAFQAQLEHLRAARHLPDADSRVLAHLEEDLDKARRQVDLAWIEHTTGG